VYTVNTKDWYMERTTSDWNGVQDWDGTTDHSFMVGMKSAHSNWYEDRKYTIFYTRSDYWILSLCRPLEKLNKFDEHLDHKLGEDEVIAGIHSEHENWYQDREFSIVVCRLVRKCGELVNITYDLAKANETLEEMFVGNSSYDNTQATMANSFTAEISVTEQETLSDSYTYARTSGHTNMHSLTVDVGYKWGPDANSGFHFDIINEFSNTWSTSESWSRSNSKSYSTGNAKQISYTANCAAGCNCNLHIRVTNGLAEIPYTIVSKSKDVGGGFCQENGVMMATRSWNAHAVSVDTC
jgi:hypothetical protein